MVLKAFNELFHDLNTGDFICVRARWGKEYTGIFESNGSNYIQMKSPEGSLWSIRHDDISGLTKDSTTKKRDNAFLDALNDAKKTNAVVTIKYSNGQSTSKLIGKVVECDENSVVIMGDDDLLGGVVKTKTIISVMNGVVMPQRVHGNW